MSTGRARAGALVAAALLVACGREAVSTTANPPAAKGAPTTVAPTTSAPTTVASTTTASAKVPPATRTMPRGVGRRMILIGDSMANESRRELQAAAAAAHLPLQLITKGKAGPCDQLGEVEAALATRPLAVAVQWIGNTRFTSKCTMAFTPDEVKAEFTKALERIAAKRLRGTTVVLVGIPPITQVPWDGSRQALDPFYRQWVATHPGFVYADTTQAVAPGDKFTRTLPCRADDVAAKACGAWGAAKGRVVVRDSLGLHFCPVKYELDVSQCPVWSSGARRYSQAIIDRLTLITGSRERVGRREPVS